MWDGATTSLETVHIDAPRDAEVLVRTAAVGICQSDLHYINGEQHYASPAIFGHEAAGIVEAVGPAVRGIEVGDHVIACVSTFCGQCKFCLLGRPALCSGRQNMARAEDQQPRILLGDTPVTAFAGLGAFAEKMLLHERAVVSIRPDVPLDRAALLGCAVTTGLGAVFNTAGVRPQDAVAVLGCGGIGLNCVQGAAIAGASRIIAIDREPSKLETAGRFGATDLVNATEGDAVAAVDELTGGGVDHSFEAIGSAATVRQAFLMLGKGGTLTLIGQLPSGASVDLPAEGFLVEKRVQGSLMGSNRFRIDMPYYLELYRSGRLLLDELIDREVRLDEALACLASPASGHSARTVIVFDP